MDKKSLYEKIVSKFTEKKEKIYSSERSINSKIETLLGLFVDGEGMSEDEFVDKYFPLFKTDSDNVRHDTSVGIKEYIEKNPYKQGNEDKKETPANVEPTNDMETKFAELEKRFNDMLLKNDMETKRKMFMSNLETKGVDKEWLSVVAEGVAFDNDFNVDDNVAKYETLYNKMKGTINPSPTPLDPKNPQEDIAKSFEYIRKAREKRINQNKTEN